MDKRLMIIACLVTALSCFTVNECLAQAVAKTTVPPQKKEHNVKVVIRKDGQLIEKDTIIEPGSSKNFIVTTRQMTGLADSLYYVVGDDVKGKKVTVTVTEVSEDGGKGSKAGTHTYTYTIGDSLQNDGSQKLVRKINGKPLIIMGNGEGDALGIPGKASSNANTIIVRKMVDPYAFDPTDPTIVSYQKKDVGKDEEKITIVRKKVK